MIKNKLTKKQKDFADDILEHGNATKAIIDNYNETTYGAARSMGSENLTKPNIRAYLEKHASNAISRIEEMSRTALNEAVKLNANKDIADRAGWKPIERVETTTKPYEELNDEELNEQIKKAQRGEI